MMDSDLALELCSNAEHLWFLGFEHSGGKISAVGRDCVVANVATPPGSPRSRRGREDASWGGEG